MIEWILLLYIFAGPLARGDSVAITTIPEFKTNQECVAAGNSLKTLTAGSAKELRFACVERTK